MWAIIVIHVAQLMQLQNLSEWREEVVRATNQPHVVLSLEIRR